MCGRHPNRFLKMRDERGPPETSVDAKGIGALLLQPLNAAVGLPLF
jgi:hypothetical protein